MEKFPISLPRNAGTNWRSDGFGMFKPLGAALMALSLLSACGGGSGGDQSATPAPSNTNNNNTTPTGGTSPTPNGNTTGNTTVAAMMMSCADGAGYQCSGDSIIRVDNGIALTRSGVQAHGRSTSDLATPIIDKTGATGFQLASGGLAEVRLAKDPNSSVSIAAVLLSDLGITWDGRTERPRIIEAFQTTQGRSLLDAQGKLNLAAVLPDSANLGFYDFASRGTAGTQVNYANNRYFPRSSPARCPASATSCRQTETDGLRLQAGDWRNGGTTPDQASAVRLHEDGDIHAGNGLPDVNGNPTILPGGSGIGVPYPGAKGYRSLVDWSLRYANMSAWLTQDTVHIAEWGGGANEHNQNRRGIVAFGDVTDPAAVPASGNASYSGFVYGWYSSSASAEPVVFRGTAVVTVNFATRAAVVTLRDTAADGSTVPVALQAATTLATGGNANYMTGTADNGRLRGGLSGRYFGPVTATGAGGSGPAEVGGAFSLSNATSGEAVVGGFIGRKQ